MRLLPFSMPQGWPVSLWFFLITAVVYLLQRFPLTGVFLMIVGAAFWSILLINMGMLGLIVEALTGRANPLWLIVPALYFGGYYWAYLADRNALNLVTAEAARFNAGKSLPFDPVRQDLAFGDPKDGMGLSPSQFVERYGLERAFGGDGRVYRVGTDETCALLRKKPVFQSAGIFANYITREGKRPYQRVGTGFCTIQMPGQPDRPIVRITERQQEAKRGRMPYIQRDFSARDESDGATAAVRTYAAQPLKLIPMPVMGCALNSGAASWDCFHGFMRDRVELPAGRPRYSGGVPLLAAMLGLKQTDDLSAHAIGPERFKPIAERADAELTAKELALLDSILARPETYIKDAWFRHLGNRPDAVEPYTNRIFDALEKLQQSDVKYSANGRELWKLAAVFREPIIAKQRSRFVEWMKPGALREWTDESWQAFALLDLGDPVQRNIVLTRLERPGGYTTELLPGFCRMGAAAPDDAKERLLRIWKVRDKLGKGLDNRRSHEDVQLYLTLNRIGLKTEAGKVDQRYMGNTFLGIWETITPGTPVDVCGMSVNDLNNRFR